MFISKADIPKLPGFKTCGVTALIRNNIRVLK